VTWNPDDPASVRSAAEGVDTLIYLLGVPYNRFELHPIIMQQTLDGAIAGGVKRIILIGTVYPYGMPVTPTVAETHPRNPTTFKGRIKSQSRTGRLQLCSCICRRQRSHLTDSAANAIRRQMPCNQEQP
jgi:hypothetical protein